MKTKKRIYGSIKELEKTGSNSTANYYKLTLYIIDKYGDYIPLTAEAGFYGYNKKTIYKALKNQIIRKYSLEV